MSSRLRLDDILYHSSIHGRAYKHIDSLRRARETLAGTVPSASAVLIQFPKKLPEREALMMSLKEYGAAVDDEQLVDLLLALLQQVQEEMKCATATVMRAVESVLYKISCVEGAPPLKLDEDDVVQVPFDGVVEQAAKAAREMAITPDMARCMDTTILPHISIGHRLAMAEVRRLLLVQASQERQLSIWMTGVPNNWGDFLAAQQLQQLVKLRLDASLGRDGFRSLCSLLSSASSSLEALELGWSTVKDARDAEALSSAIVTPGCRLQSLSIRSKIGREGMESLSQALQHSAGCPVWHLSLMIVDEEGLRPLAEALKNERCSLRMLGIRGEMSEAVWEALGHSSCKVECLLLWREQRHGHIDLARRARIWFLGIDDPSKELVEAIRFNTSVTHLQVKVGEEKARAALAEFVGSPDCKLEYLSLRQTYLGTRDDTREMVLQNKLLHREKVLAAIEGNYRSRLTTLQVSEHFPFVKVGSRNRRYELTTLEGGGDSYRLYEQARCKHIVKRNQLFLSLATEQQQAFEEASCSKLFICGKGGAGKTTLATNLKRKFSYPAFLQRHSTTQGIHMPGSITYNKNRLVICDVAGQEEYHAFHHYFMRGSDKNIFIVVCKVLLKGDNSALAMDLRYWLRFITSHRSVSPDRKPKVLIALNYWGPTTIKQEGNRTCREQVLSIAQEYSQVLHIEPPVFEVVALNASDLHPLKEALGQALQQVLQQHSKVPAMCKLIQNFKHGQQDKKWWRKGKAAAPMVMTIEELAAKLFPKSSNDDMKARTDAIKFSLVCMHDMGESLYFGTDFETDQTMSESAVLDMQWFVQKLVSIFITVSRQPDQQRQQYTLPMINVAPMIEEKCSFQHLAFVLRSLHNMGVLLPWDKNWDQSTWSANSPATVIIPAVLTEPFKGVSDDPDRVFWGRRIMCEDIARTLLPSGVFTMLQVEIRDMCKNDSAMDIGQGWISFRENTVYAVARVGGSTQHWADRQWVDVLVTAPKNEKKCLQAESTMVQIKAHIRNICKSSLPSLRLKECVLNPAYASTCVVEGTGQFEITTQSIAVPIEEIYREAAKKDEGLTYNHSWSPQSENEIGELLMPGEVQAHVQTLTSDIMADYEKWVGKRYELPPLQPWKDIIIKHAGDDLIVVLLERLDDRLGRMEQRLDNIDQHLVNVEAGIQDLRKMAKQTQTALNDYGKQVMAACSKMLDKLDVSCPRFPYVTDGENSISKYLLQISKLAETLRLHYCCESSAGIHHVARSPGLDMAVARPWFRKHSHVIVPAITTFFFVTKIASAAAGPAKDVIGTVVDSVKACMEATLESILTPELRDQWKQRPSEKDLKELFEMVEKKKGQQRLDSFMDKTFGLRQRGKKWLCAECCNTSASQLVKAST